MSSKMQHGYLLLADISGYTSFLARTELDHAQEILSELLELLVKRMQPPLQLSKLEGDAVFLFAPDTAMSSGQMLLDLVDSTYVAFRDKLLSMQRATTCQCAACRAMPSLDLKFITHRGSFILQSVAGRDEVVGSDVNLVHRLLKNQVVEATGWRAYALFSETCLDELGVPKDALHEDVEEYEHLGPIKTYSLDLRARYKEITEARHVVVEPGEAEVTLSRDLAAPVPVIWDLVTDPSKRGLWMSGTTWTAASRPNGRAGAGAVNHCAHGSGGITVEDILDWRPYDYFTAFQHEEGSKMTSTMTFRFVPIEGGTRLQILIKGKFPVPAFLNRVACNITFTKLYDMGKMLKNLEKLVGEGVPTAFATA